MSLFPAIESYLPHQGAKYISPDMRPHFWNYLKGYGEITEPMFALRLYGTAEDFGVSLEVSFMERKKDEHSLSKQNRVLELPIQSPAYYFAQIDGVSQRFEGTEENRQLAASGRSGS